MYTLSSLHTSFLNEQDPFFIQRLCGCLSIDSEKSLCLIGKAALFTGTACQEGNYITKTCPYNIQRFFEL